MIDNSKIKIRPANLNDKYFVISLLPRLAEFGLPAWRNEAQMVATDAQIVTDKLLVNQPGTAIFIAEDEKNNPLGFIHLHTGNDYYNKEKHGHISDVIIAPGLEGLGIGLLLMNKGEEWARSNGYRWLTLSVFAQNVRARELYNKLGYGEDIMKYVKQL